ncbi:sterile alpha motif domain-containing protein 7 isoform X1 [Artibeus jamaicensis]|uniref:sterile alpha motif domain-containing protein 7 isoform X1 n=2 Tax=Artibeus jamaicensis TaxID=9417 RepID=UPI00235AFCCE|nr:sterile alpha motif domain-containing protein 7 isoform X1 [Artibeus jamaicensis]XP_053514035.1 sterile alpha motif domain-containing protein 7 isoform X1 [Artibeus jamaicensis]
MDPKEPRRDTPVAGEPGSPEERHLYRLSSGMTLEEFHQWREVLMINSTMATNPLLTASGQQRIPLAPSPFEPPTVDRDLLPSTVAPTDPRQFCVPSQFGSSVLPNANMPNMMSNRVYSGWGILPPESLKAVARRNEMIQRQHTARMEMEMHAIYQQRRIEKVNPKGLAGLAIPFLYGSSISAGPATCHRRAMLPASDLHLHRRSLRNLHGNPMLVATGPHFLEGWGQKCPHLRRGAGNQKVLESDTESSKSQTEEKSLGEIHVIPYIEDEYAKGPEIEARNNQKSREINKKPPAVLANDCGEMEPTHRKPWGTHDTRMEAKAWDRGRQKVSEQCSAARDEKNGVYPPLPQPSLSGTHVLVTSGENPSLDEDIQKWTVSDVHDFISGLPGCSDYAQVFKDHAIDGETLPLLTEEHLRSTMGLKLGPALKIQLQVSQHVESMLYKKSFSLPTHTKQAFDQPADTSSPLDFNPWGDTLESTCSQDIIIPKGTEQDSMRN